MIPEAIKPYLPMITGILIALVILITGWILSKWTHRLIVKVFEKRKLDEALGRFLGGIGQYTVLAAAFIAALGAVGVETTSLVAVFASAGLAIGLALQGSLANFASGVMILFFRPFTLNDVINAGGHVGRVDDIGVFATTLVTPDNEKIIVPNGAIMGGSITNYTARGTRRGGIEVGVAYGADAPTVMAILDKAAQRCELVLADPAPAVAFVGLGASSIDFKVLAWAKAGDYFPMLGQVRQAIYEDLNAAGIDIPFQQVVVHQAA